jgi:hypothetical protein
LVYLVDVNVPSQEVLVKQISALIEVQCLDQLVSKKNNPDRAGEIWTRCDSSEKWLESSFGAVRPADVGIEGMVKYFLGCTDKMSRYQAEVEQCKGILRV